MKTVNVPETEYKKLLEENNSLRKLISGFVDAFSKLNSAQTGAEKKAPKVSEAEKVLKMTPAQLKRYYSKKINSK